MKLWESKGVAKEAIDFASGWDNKDKGAYDDLLIPYDLRLSRVYAKELRAQKHITAKEMSAIKKGLEHLMGAYSRGKLDVSGYEDVHSTVEGELAKVAGGSATGNIHLGKSRNDQVNTVMRMWMRDKAGSISQELSGFISVIGKEAKKHGNKVLPGYSHHRVAMPTTYGALLESYLSALERDLERMKNWKKMYNFCPLGTGAGFGSTVKLDRNRLAKQLGFRGPLKSSIDAASTRWEAEASLAFCFANMLIHLAAIAQDFIYLSSAGIDVLKLPAKYCTGSSIMPQKRNPDVLEAVKAKSAVARGKVVALMNLGSGNISGYNRDTQWTKYIIMDLVREFEGLFGVVGGVVRGVKVDDKRAEELLGRENAYAAEKATKEALGTGKPFRRVKGKAEKKIKGGKR